MAAAWRAASPAPCSECKRECRRGHRTRGTDLLLAGVGDDVGVGGGLPSTSAHGREGLGWHVEVVCVVKVRHDQRVRVPRLDLEQREIRSLWVT
eukprot:982511-Prymnesium_polylepis.2